MTPSSHSCNEKQRDRERNKALADTINLTSARINVIPHNDSMLSSMNWLYFHIIYISSAPHFTEHFLRDLIHTWEYCDASFTHKHLLHHQMRNKCECSKSYENTRIYFENLICESVYRTKIKSANTKLFEQMRRRKKKRVSKRKNKRAKHSSNDTAQCRVYRQIKKKEKRWLHLFGRICEVKLLMSFTV